MSAWCRMFRCERAQALVEFTLTLPLLIVLGLGAIEFSNMINAYLVLTHLTREGANLTSRQDESKGTSQWATDVNADLTAVINAASPVIKNTTASETAQWNVIYSMIVENPGANCGFLSDGVTIDRYVIERNNPAPTWTNPTWTYGTLGQTSKIGADGACANVELPNISAMPPFQTLHVIEVFYDYAPSLLTPLGGFIGSILPATFYTRTIFTDVSGTA
jgi:Flp pilus assembly protein TadG